MITLEQIRRLEKRVHTAVSLITALKGENTLLKQKLTGYERRIAELEAKLVELKEGQSEIERGLLAALDQLDTLEDELLDDPPPGQGTPAADMEQEDHGEVIVADKRAEAAGSSPSSPASSSGSKPDSSPDDAEDTGAHPPDSRHSAVAGNTVSDNDTAGRSSVPSDADDSVSDSDEQPSDELDIF